MIEIARHSRLVSGADYVVANTLAMVSQKQGGFGAGAFLVGETGEEWIARDELAALLAVVAQRWWTEWGAGRVVTPREAFSCD